MNIYNKSKRENNSYRGVYRKHFGKIPKDNQGRSYDIHHIDGNHRNADPSNLIAIPIEEHYEIHLRQGDHRACALIALRMDSDTKRVSEMASIAAKKKVKDGTHHWLSGISQSISNQTRVKNGTHHLLNNKMQKENAEKRIEKGSHNFLQGSTCPHCGHVGKNSSAMSRWHFNNCKLVSSKDRSPPNKGKKVGKHSEETIQRMKDAQLARWIKKKENTLSQSFVSVSLLLDIVILIFSARLKLPSSSDSNRLLAII
jgi:hypothetical protein